MTNLLMRSEFVAMTLDVSLQDKDFCLTFWYRSKTEATFKVSLIIVNQFLYTKNCKKVFTSEKIQV